MSELERFVLVMDPEMHKTVVGLMERLINDLTSVGYAGPEIEYQIRMEGFNAAARLIISRIKKNIGLED